MRRFSIDGKFGIDEQGQLIKISNGEVLPEDEPLFLVRARDRLAIPLLQVYEVLSRMDGCNDWHHAKLERTISAFIQFSKDHPERMKQPSITMGK